MSIMMKSCNLKAVERSFSFYVQPCKKLFQHIVLLFIDIDDQFYPHGQTPYIPENVCKNILWSPSGQLGVPNKIIKFRYKLDMDCYIICFVPKKSPPFIFVL